MTVFVDLIAAVGVGVSLMSLLYVRDTAEVWTIIPLVRECISAPPVPPMHCGQMLSLRVLASAGPRNNGPPQQQWQRR